MIQIKAKQQNISFEKSVITTLGTTQREQHQGLPRQEAYPWCPPPLPPRQ